VVLSKMILAHVTGIPVEELLPGVLVGWCRGLARRHGSPALAPAVGASPKNWTVADAQGEDSVTKEGLLWRGRDSNPRRSGYEIALPGYVRCSVASRRDIGCCEVS
jgi:hypothetical protein